MENIYKDLVCIFTSSVLVLMYVICIIMLALIRVCKGKYLLVIMQHEIASK